MKNCAHDSFVDDVELRICQLNVVFGMRERTLAIFKLTDENEEAVSILQTVHYICETGASRVMTDCLVAGAMMQIGLT